MSRPGPRRHDRWREDGIIRGLVATLVVVMLSGAQRGAAADAPGPPETHALLDVPYFAQPPELCGGAAVAMVLRYWGDRNVFPLDFAPLVDSQQNGIETRSLTSAVIDRGWQALVLPATENSARAQIQSEIDRGRPVIALIEVAPRTYH